MYRIFIFTIAVIVFSGCAMTEEAYYVDREFGVAQNDAFTQQIANRTPDNANTTPVGMDGIHSEKIMETYQASFDKSDGEAPTNNFTRGTINRSEFD